MDKKNKFYQLISHLDFLLILLYFFIEELRLLIRRIKILHVFFKEFNIFLFIVYLFNNSIIPSREKAFKNFILKNSQKWKIKDNSKKKN